MANIQDKLENARVISTKDQFYKWIDKSVGDANGGKLEITIDGEMHIVDISEDGKWSFDPKTSWLDGTHVIQLVSIDKATNPSNPTIFILDMDTTPPAKPEIWRVIDDAAAEDRYLTPGDATSDKTPALSGVAEPGTIVTLYDNGKEIGSVVADKMGAWSITPELADGEHKLTVMAKDTVGHESPISDAFNLTIADGVVTQAVNEAVSETPAEAAIVDAANSAGEPVRTINTKVITISGGNAEPNALVQIVIDETVYTTRADASGKWQFESPELKEGLHVAGIRYLDRAGNWGSSTPRIYNIDTSAPEAPQIMRVIDNEGSADTYLTPGNYTNDKTPTLYGVAQPDSLVKIYDIYSKAIGSVKAGADGRWSFTPELTTDGTHVFSASYTDRFGAESPRSDNFALTLDTKVPDAPSLNEVFDDEGRVTGPLKSGDITDDKTPTLSGRGDAGVIVRVWDGDKLIGSTVVDSRGEWKLEVELGEGEHSLVVDSISKGGTVSEKTDPFKLVVDSNILPAPVVDEMVANNGDEERVLQPGDSTNDTTPVLRGAGNNGDVISVIVDGEPVASAIVRDGKWEIELPELAEGSHDIELIAKDPSTGKESPTSDPINVIIDITPPDQPKPPTIIDNEGDKNGPVEPGQPIDDNRPGFGGDGGNPGDKVEVIIEDGTGNKVVIGTGIVGEDGKWEVKPENPIDDGNYQVIIGITDPAGNESQPSDPIDLIIDTKKPGSMEGSYVLEDNVGPIQGNIENGMVTDDKQPTLKGTSPDLSQVIIYIDDLEPIVVDVIDGKWSYELPELGEGNHKVEVQPVSQSGVKGDKEAAINFDVDTTKPEPVEGGPKANFEGVFADKTGIEIPVRPDTNDDTLIFKGKGSENGSIVMIWADEARENLIGSTVVQNGVWRYESDKLAEGDYAFNVTIRDAAGNELVIDHTVKTNVDVTPPPPPPEINSIFAAGATDVEGLMSMSLNDIMAQGQDSLFIDNGKSQLVVNAKQGEALTLEDILPAGEDASSWQQATGTVTVGGNEYNVYSNGDAELLVQNLHNEQH
ncbi:Ig-like domain-containing protein [Pantoea dispersa]|uniref:Ig-like domain-containing protein n=1 Tax=Pantoea dispersa TaxID=59814 RepID=UPI0028DFFC42|nr:Ig-like domain-containing protein [Pantoea dispersa]MDT8849566.1 Ig-like domain-containing protein [Pantoea dispersa]